ncbi:MAG: hypothetical protein HY314_01305 [Acidobacteria bacterium]|nr:hypothetical protein [Acidobacteriota bacterium]
MQADPFRTNHRIDRARRNVKVVAVLVAFFLLFASWIITEGVSRPKDSQDAQMTMPGQKIEFVAGASSAPLMLEKKDTCVECHTQMGDELAAPVTEMQNDVHHRRGLSCADCHGGDPSQSDPTLDELQFRRKGLAASLLVIVAAVVAIFLKIKQIEGQQGRSEQ